jgi:restriction endonuclease
MEWQLTDARKGQYGNLLKAAQDLEMTIGSNQYRIQKLINMRSELDVSLKKWWEDVLKELALDPKLDYMITQEGTIKEVIKPAPSSDQIPPKVTEVQSKIGTNAAELK